MELFLDHLISNHILTSADIAAISLPHREIRCISVYEPYDSEFFQRLKPQTLLFFTSKAVQNITLQQVSIMAAQNCAIVLYEDDLSLWDFASFPVPVLLLPPEQTISGALSQCYHQAYSSMQKLAEASLQAMEKLSNELLNSKSGNENIITIANDLLKCPVAFSTSDFHLQKAPHTAHAQDILVVNPLCAENTFNWDLALASFALTPDTYHPCLAEGISGTKISGYLHRNKYCQQQGCQIFIFPITDGGNRYGYVFLAPDDKMTALSPERGIQLQQILAILKFEIIKSDEIAHTINCYYDFLLNELIESDRTDLRELMGKYGLVQKKIYDEYYILVAGRRPHSTSEAPFHELLRSQQFNSLYGQLVEALGTINFFLFERKDYIVTLLPKELISDVKKDLEPLIAIFRGFLKEQYQGLGISNAAPTREVRQGYLQALKALTISQNAADLKPYFYSDLGILRFFFDHANRVDFAPLLQVYKEYISPVVEYDEQHGGELLPTLTAYIVHRCSPSAICSALYIHKNTLYSRLNKISQLLSQSLTDSETIFNISLGLKIQTLLEAGILQKELDP